MRGGNIEVLTKLGIGYYIVHILRQTLSHIVIYFIVCFVVSVVSRSYENCKYDEKHRKNLNNTLREFPHMWDNRAMLRFLKRFVKYKDQ